MAVPITILQCDLTIFTIYNDIITFQIAYSIRPTQVACVSLCLITASVSALLSGGTVLQMVTSKLPSCTSWRNITAVILQNFNCTAYYITLGWQLGRAVSAVSHWQGCSISYMWSSLWLWALALFPLASKNRSGLVKVPVNFNVY